MTSANSMSILKVCAIWRDARWRPVLRNWLGYVPAVVVRLKALAPYALIELVLPGGTLMALLLWLYRRRKNGVGYGQFPGGLAPGLPSPISPAFNASRISRVQPAAGEIAFREGLVL